MKRWMVLLSGYLAALAALAGLIVLSQYRFSLFHLVIGLFSVVIAACIFILAWNTRRYHQSGFLLLIGIAFVYVAAFDLLYLITPSDLGLFPGIDEAIFLHFWVGARWIESAGLLLAPLFSRRRIPVLPTILAFGAVASVFTVLIFEGRVPVDVGSLRVATLFCCMQYALVPAALVAAMFLIHRVQGIHRRTLVLLEISMAVSIVSYTMWMVGDGVHQPLIIASQVFRVGSIYLTYRAILKTGIERPFNLLFRDVKIKEKSLQEAHDRLELRVRDRTAELTMSNDMLSREIRERREAEKTLRHREADLRALARRLITAQEDERLHLSRELHDEAGQALTALKLELEMVAEDLDDDMLRQRIVHSAELAERTMEHIRRLAHGLRPPALDTLGLETSLQELCHEFGRRTGLRVSFVGDVPEEPPDEISISTYRILQEALTNVAKHAEATSVRITVGKSESSLCLLVIDDGVGFDARAESSSGGMGLKGVRERVEQLGGRFDLSAQPGSGSRLSVCFDWETST